MSDPAPDVLSYPPFGVVPRPRKAERGEGVFTPPAMLRLRAASPEASPVLRRLEKGLERLGLSSQTVPEAMDPTEIKLEFDSELATVGPEAYVLETNGQGVIIRASAAAGWGHGVQTLLDLWDSTAGNWPEVLVTDEPRFGWRGMLLDCCRHFVSKPVIFRILDGMAAGKLNRLHWHLTDDQAWRIEIKRYPRLTEIGARRSDENQGVPQFYSHEDIREVVRYARERGIEIMPEIEMPGHATAALAAYPELGCIEDPVQVTAAWGLFPNNFNAGDERVFSFLENVLEEVVDLFPFPYIHLGADECNKTQWQQSADCQRRMQEEGLADETALQSYFVNRIAAFLRRHDRTAMAWDEILEGEPEPGMWVQAWRDERIIKLAVARGFPVIASPRRYCYLDMAINQIDVATVRGFDPAAGLDSESAKMVLGGEATMWTEYVEEAELEHMIFPRLWGLGEALWCGVDNQTTLAEFEVRLAGLIRRARSLGLQPGPSFPDEVTAEAMKGRTDLDEPAPGVENLA
jgi:hexosaminidase